MYKNKNNYGKELVLENNLRTCGSKTIFVIIKTKPKKYALDLSIHILKTMSSS